ncbi:LacI family DNA-binding transcriptional regulator [soil metagenome]
MANRRPTLQDIAKKLNVSAASVSRALADNQRISPGLRALVQKTAAEIGYVPNTAARALRTGKPDMAALMVPNLSVLRTDGNLDVLQAMDEEMGQQGIRLLVASYHQPSLVPSTMRKVLADPRMAGLLFLTNYITEQLLEVISRSPTAAVLVNAYPERTWENWEGLYCSGTENLFGADLATKHLIANGHTRIGALVCEPGQRDADLREEGYLDAMKDAGLDTPPNYLVRCDFLRGFETGRRAISRMLTSNTGDQKPTAIFCSSDDIAAGAIRGLADAGVRVPQDMEIVGFGNHPLSVGLTPPVSTVTHDGGAVGRGAARLFLKLLNGEVDQKESQLLQPAELIVRESSPTRSPAPTLRRAAVPKTPTPKTSVA